jgi:hypothetical protein
VGANAAGDTEVIHDKKLPAGAGCVGGRHQPCSDGTGPKWGGRAGIRRERR